MKKNNNEKEKSVKKELRQLILYLFVGGLATIVEWSVFNLLNDCLAMHYMVATALAFIVSTFANWAFGKLILFHGNFGIWKELVKIYLTSIAGLLMNLVIMWITVEKIGINEFPSKVIATGIVFLWNFLVRKLLIYKI